MKPIQKELDEIVKFIEEDGKTAGENIPEECKEYDDEAYYYDPFEDGDLWDDDTPDYEEASRQRVPDIQKEIQEAQAELDEQLRILGDTSKPVILLIISRNGAECYEDEIYTTITCLNPVDGCIIEELTQTSTRSLRDWDYCCSEEIDALNQLTRIQRHLKLAKSGYKVIISHYL